MAQLKPKVTYSKEGKKSWYQPLRAAWRSANRSVPAPSRRRSSAARAQTRSATAPGRRLATSSRSCRRRTVSGRGPTRSEPGIGFSRWAYRTPGTRQPHTSESDPDVPRLSATKRNDVSKSMKDKKSLETKLKLSQVRLST